MSESTGRGKLGQNIDIILNSRPAPPQTGAPPVQTSPDAAKFKQRLGSIMKQVVDVGTFNAAIPANAQAAAQYAKTDPAQALQMLDAIEEDLAKIAKKSGALVQAAQLLRLEWEMVAKEKLDADPTLAKTRAAVLLALQQQKPKEAAKGVMELKQKATVVKEAREENRLILASRWLLRQAKDKESIKDVKDKGDKALAAEMAKELAIPEDAAAELIKSAFARLEADTNSLRGDAGTKLMKGKFGDKGRVINPVIPKESRPELTVEEMGQVNYYTADGYDQLNKDLRAGAAPAGKGATCHQEMQKAFAKTEPFPTPIRVTRGLKIDDMDAYLKPYRAARKAQKEAAAKGEDKTVPVPIKGYMSTGTLGVPPAFKNNVELVIIAKQGLDLSPYTDLTHEKELLLNHETPVKVHKIVKQKNGHYKLYLEQILPQEQ